MFCFSCPRLLLLELNNVIKHNKNAVLSDKVLMNSRTTTSPICYVNVLHINMNCAFSDIDCRIFHAKSPAGFILLLVNWCTMEETSATPILLYEPRWVTQGVTPESSLTIRPTCVQTSEHSCRKFHVWLHSWRGKDRWLFVVLLSAYVVCFTVDLSATKNNIYHPRRSQILCVSDHLWVIT